MFEGADEPGAGSDEGLALLVDALVAGLTELASRADALRDAELVDAVREVESAGRHVDALRVRLTGEVGHRSRRELGPERLAARYGCRSAVELVQRLTGVSGATASARQKLGLAVRPETGLTGEPVPPRFAHVARALEAGELPLDAAQAIVRALDPTRRVATAEHVDAAEAELVAAAIGAEPPTPGAPPDAASTGGTGSHGDSDSDSDSDERERDGRESDGPGSDGPGSDGRGSDEPSPEPARCGRRRRRAPALDADGVRAQARLWAEFLDPDGALPAERDAERRFLTLHAKRHGLVPISGLLLPEVAASLERYADACTNPRTAPLDDPARSDGPNDGRAAGVLPDRAMPTAAGGDDTGHDSDGGTASSGGGGTASSAGPRLDPRSRAQQLHDVLATIVAVAARAADAPSVAGNAPTLVVVARAEDVEAGRGAARTEDGAPLSIALARQVACAGAVQRVTVDESGRVVGIWAPDRCFTGAQRRAIATRDRGCVIPGCHVPVAWCEVHHVTPHADDPDGTHTDNGVLLCWHHHRTLDSSGWAVRMVDGIPWTRPPTWLDPSGRWTRHSPGPPLRRAG
jgi:5-methylcytosine-specific restriction protein A